MAWSIRPDRISNIQSRAGDPVPSRLRAEARKRSHRSFKAAFAPSSTAVIARLDRAIQYSREAAMESRSRGVLDHPLEPVIGLAAGETRWRVMTVHDGAAACHRLQYVIRGLDPRIHPSSQEASREKDGLPGHPARGACHRAARCADPVALLPGNDS
jgi:hypothetical protein